MVFSYSVRMPALWSSTFFLFSSSPRPGFGYLSISFFSSKLSIADFMSKILKVASRLFRTFGKISVSSLRVPAKQSLTRRSAPLREYLRCLQGFSIASSYSFVSSSQFASIAFFNSLDPSPLSSGYLRSCPSSSIALTVLKMSMMEYLSPNFCFRSPTSPAKFPAKQSLTIRCATIQEYLRCPSGLPSASSISLETLFLRLSIVAIKYSLLGSSLLGYFSTYFILSKLRSAS